MQTQLIDAWQTNNRVTEFFFEHLPGSLWGEKIPGAPQRTIRMIAGHIHNARCMWIKLAGKHFDVPVPASVDRRHVNKEELLQALPQSSLGIIELLRAGLANDGVLGADVPWANIPPDVTHFATYLIAHEAHHRGQIVLAARALGQRLPPVITNGLWQWKQRRREAEGQ